MRTFLFFALPLSFLFNCCAPSGEYGGQFSNEVYDSLRHQLEEMYDLDQGYRKQIAEMKSFDFELVNKMNRADSLNQVQVKEILREYGWLPKSRIGEKASDAIFFVLQHGDLATMEIYLPDLQTLAGKGEAKKTHAAMMEDRILMRQNKKQIYGTQARQRPRKDGTIEYYIWPIQTPEKVNELRAQMGFKLTVEKNAERLNAIYNPKDTIPES